jgi:hypothetical protein
VTCTNGQLSSYNSSVYKYQSCTPASGCACTTPSGGSVPSGQSTTLYSNSAATCAAPTLCSATGNSVTVTCNNGQFSTFDASTFKYQTCTTPVCSCTTPSGGSVPNGQTVTLYSVSTATCTSPNLCSASGSSVSVTCTAGQFSSFDPTTYKYQSCANPVCTCSANGQLINIGSTVGFFKSATAPTGVTCSQIEGMFSCVAGTPPTLSGPGPLTQYPAIACTDYTDQGTLGGTGGGTGNSDGPGSALRKRLGLPDGAGGPGGCTDAVQCPSNTYFANAGPGYNNQPCLLPWGGGEIEMYGTIMAFNTQCVVSGTDKCSAHRQSRTCHYPVFTGSSAYQYPSCAEKASCP